MLVTVIIDAYKQDQKEEIAHALNELCSPIDSYGFSSAGVYSFWNPETREVLYLGLARDLGDRFAQHNDLRHCKPQHCKKQKIQGYFKQHEYLGYSILVQASLAQPLGWRNLKPFGKEKAQIKKDYADWSQQHIDHIQHLEGLLIETFHMVHGRFPEWNDVPGSVEGQRMASVEAKTALECLAGRDGPILARKTLRQLSEDATSEYLEEVLHSARIRVVLLGEEIKEAIRAVAATNPIAAQRIDEIKAYLLEKPTLFMSSASKSL